MDKSLSVNKPPIQDSAEDFFITLDFAPGEGDATRIFRTAVGLINAFNRFDLELVRGFDVNVKSHLTLDRIEEGSIRIFLRSVLQTLDDDALKSGDWKVLRVIPPPDIDLPPSLFLT